MVPQKTGSVSSFKYCTPISVIARHNRLKMYLVLFRDERDTTKRLWPIQGTRVLYRETLVQSSSGWPSVAGPQRKYILDRYFLFEKKIYTRYRSFLFGLAWVTYKVKVTPKCMGDLLVNA